MMLPSQERRLAKEALLFIAIAFIAGFLAGWFV